MPQLFPRSANPMARISIGAGALLAVGVISLLMAIVRSPYQTDVGTELNQPVPFSHDHHTEVLGISCAYCHTSVEIASSAGIPPTQTCMNCHNIIWADTPMLEPVRESWRNDEPIRWNRVHDLPDYVYFNHSAHVTKGIGCNECHGQVNEMPLIYQAESLQMSWCLDCHRNPEQFVRPKDEVYNMNWQPPAGVDRAEFGRALVAEYEINSQQTCSTCHR
ncbi:MAG: cytochrome c3 family protein [Acidobacteriota bacterium]